MDATFPNLASFDVQPIVKPDGTHYVRRIDVHAELSKRGLWVKFTEIFTARNRRYTEQGDFIAWDAEQTIYELLNSCIAQ
jgi:hypothetical protein